MAVLAQREVPPGDEPPEKRKLPDALKLGFGASGGGLGGGLVASFSSAPWEAVIAITGGSAAAGFALTAWTLWLQRQSERDQRRHELQMQRDKQAHDERMRQLELYKDWWEHEEVSKAIDKGPETTRAVTGVPEHSEPAADSASKLTPSPTDLQPTVRIVRLVRIFRRDLE